MGSSFGGFTFFVNKEQKLQFSYNYLGLEEFKTVSADKVPEGKATLKLEFTQTGPPDFKTGKGAPGTTRLLINGKQVGQGKVDATCPLNRIGTGLPSTCSRPTVSVRADGVLAG